MDRLSPLESNIHMLARYLNEYLEMNDMFALASCNRYLRGTLTSFGCGVGGKDLLSILESRDYSEFALVCHYQKGAIGFVRSNDYIFRVADILSRSRYSWGLLLISIMKMIRIPVLCLARSSIFMEKRFAPVVDMLQWDCFDWDLSDETLEVVARGDVIRRTKSPRSIPKLHLKPSPTNPDGWKSVSRSSGIMLCAMEDYMVELLWYLTRGRLRKAMYLLMQMLIKFDNGKLVEKLRIFLDSHPFGAYLGLVLMGIPIRMRVKSGGSKSVMKACLIRDRIIIDNDEIAQLRTHLIKRCCAQFPHILELDLADLLSRRILLLDDCTSSQCCSTFLLYQPLCVVAHEGRSLRRKMQEAIESRDYLAYESILLAFVSKFESKMLLALMDAEEKSLELYSDGSCARLEENLDIEMELLMGLPVDYPWGSYNSPTIQQSIGERDVGLCFMLHRRTIANFSARLDLEDEKKMKNMHKLVCNTNPKWVKEVLKSVRY